MGNTKSKVTIDTESVNNTVNEYITTNKTIQGTSTQALQKINLKNAVLYCNLDVTQDADISVKTIQQFENQDNIDLINKVITNLDDQMKQKLDEKDGWLSIPNNKKIYENVKQSVTTNLTNKITNTNINETITKVGGSQKADISNVMIDPCGMGQLKNTQGANEFVAQIVDDCVKSTGNKCDIGQNMTIDTASTQIGLNIFQVLSSNQDVKDLQAKVDQDTEAQSGGIDSFVSSIGSALSKIFTAAWLPFVIGIVLVFGLLIAWFISSGEKPTNVIKAAGNVGTKVAVPELAVAGAAAEAV